jgi:hypothetical protein
MAQKIKSQLDDINAIPPEFRVSREELGFQEESAQLESQLQEQEGELRRFSELYDAEEHKCEMRVLKLGKAMLECRKDQEALLAEIKAAKLHLKQRRDAMMNLS